ncbi:MAG: hypothetical protein V3V31_15445 [Methylococcales bacterium]
MSRFLKALAKAGLVSLSDEEQQQVDQSFPADSDDALQAILDDNEIEHMDRSSTEASAGSVAATDDTDLPENLPFEDIYTGLGIKPSPYSAEKLLRVLDGLKAMDPATRKTAVTAMDAADDEWTIEDPVLDAQRKIKALEKHKSTLAKIVANAETAAEHNLATQTEYQNQATQTLRNEITALEQRLESELADVATEKASIQSHLQATRDASIRELSRLDKEIIRLGELPATFIPEKINQTK